MLISLHIHAHIRTVVSKTINGIRVWKEACTLKATYFIIYICKYNTNLQHLTAAGVGYSQAQDKPSH